MRVKLLFSITIHYISVSDVNHCYQKISRILLNTQNWALLSCAGPVWHVDVDQHHHQQGELRPEPSARTAQAPGLEQTPLQWGQQPQVRLRQHVCTSLRHIKSSLPSFQPVLVRWLWLLPAAVPLLHQTQLPGNTHQYHSILTRDNISSVWSPNWWDYLRLTPGPAWLTRSLWVGQTPMCHDLITIKLSEATHRNNKSHRLFVRIYLSPLDIRCFTIVAEFFIQHT